MREFFVFEATKGKDISCGIRALAIGVPFKVFLRALLRALQTGKMVSIDFLFPVSVTLEHHHADTLLALSLKRTSNELACRSEEFMVF